MTLTNFSNNLNKVTLIFIVRWHQTCRVRQYTIHTRIFYRSKKQWSRSFLWKRKYYFGRFSQNRFNYLYLFKLKNNLVLWDLRKFQDLRKPVALIEEPKPIKTFKFCPSKPGRVAVLLEAANSVNIYRLEERDNLIYKDTVNCKRLKYV